MKPAEAGGLSLPSVSAGFLLHLVLDPENGGDMFLRNAGFSLALQPRKPYTKYVQDYTASRPTMYYVL
jgi:hypothetical protein